MYTDNKIRKATEITNAGTHAPFGAFYVFIIPKTTESPSSSVFKGKISLSNSGTSFPISSNYWNPVVVNEIEVSSSDLANYRIFAGAE